MNRLVLVVALALVFVLVGCTVETPKGSATVRSGIGGWLLQMEQQYTSRYQEREETRRYEAQLRAETEARRQETVRWLLAGGAVVAVVGLWMWGRRSPTVIVQQAPMLAAQPDLPPLPEPMFWDVVDGEWAVIDPDRREIVLYKDGQRLG